MMELVRKQATPTTTPETIGFLPIDKVLTIWSLVLAMPRNDGGNGAAAKTYDYKRVMAAPVHRMVIWFPRVKLDDHFTIHVNALDFTNWNQAGIV